MEVLNISKGEWKICFDGQIDCNGKKICSGLGFECYKEFNENAEAKDNAQLIIEAGNTCNKTGFTPRQLADQKVKLVNALKDIHKFAESQRFDVSNCRTVLMSNPPQNPIAYRIACDSEAILREVCEPV